MATVNAVWFMAAGAGGGGGGSNWIATIGSGPSNDSGWGVSVDSTGNVNVSGNNPSSNVAYVLQLSPTATINWQFQISGNDYTFTGVSQDTSGSNVFVTGYKGAFPLQDAVLGQISGGVFSAPQEIGYSGAVIDLGYDVAVDTTGYAYICGATTGAGVGGQDISLTKYGFGSVQWSRVLGDVSGEDQGWGCAFNGGSGDIVVAGFYTDPVTFYYRGVVASYNPFSGTLMGQRELYDSSGSISVRFYDCATDTGTGAIYTGGYVSASPYDKAVVCKYNSTLSAFFWGYEISSFLGNLRGRCVASDSAGGVYLAADDSNSNGIYICYFDSSGIMQWQRTLTSSNGGMSVKKMDWSSGSIYICGTAIDPVTFTDDIMVANLPEDGTGTGTHGDYTYSSVAYSVSSTTLTDAAGILADNTASPSTTTGPFPSTSTLTATATSF